MSDTDVAVDAEIAELSTDLRGVTWRLVRHYRRDRTLPTSQVSALVWIDTEGPITTSRLATLEHVRPQSMAHTVSQLEAGRLIARRPDPNDGRKVLLDLTPAGQATLAQLRADGDSWVTAALSRRFTVQERADLARGLELLGRLASE